jgi:DNA-binding LytR/AlgR family response regulator
MTSPPGLRVLVADDEAPAREELAWLLGHHPAVGSVRTASSGAEVLKALEDLDVDALFLDIRMPGLDGLDVARVLARFKAPPKVVFVTAYDEHAVEAFDLRAVDYLLKPVREERLAEAVRPGGRRAGRRHRSGGHRRRRDHRRRARRRHPVRAAQRRAVRRGARRLRRLHTASESHLVRVPLTTLEQQWAAAGFVRIHRSHLVSLRHIDEMRVDSGHWTVRVGDDVLQVSRRHSRELRDMLVRQARPGQQP